MQIANLRLRQNFNKQNSIACARFKGSQNSPPLYKSFLNGKLTLVDDTLDISETGQDMKLKKAIVADEKGTLYSIEIREIGGNFESIRAIKLDESRNISTDKTKEVFQFGRQVMMSQRNGFKFVSEGQETTMKLSDTEYKKIKEYFENLLDPKKEFKKTNPL